MKCVIILLFILTSCNPSRSEDFASEGKSWMRSMTKELKTIRSKEDLEKSIPLITRKYKQLALLIKRIEENKAVNYMPDEGENEESILLKEQLDRIFLLPKAKEIFETAQIDALEILSTVKSRRVKKE